MDTLQHENVPFYSWHDAVRDSFAGDLPPEYRELLEDYYKVLSK